MTSVTQRIKQITQPRGGYLPPKSFTEESLPAKTELAEKENIHPSLVGLAVDYLTRALTSGNAQSAFTISLSGAALIKQTEYAQVLLKKVAPLISSQQKSPILWADAVTAAAKLSGYDVCFRAGIQGYRPVQEIAPDADTINNIKIMVERSLVFLEKYGPAVKDGIIFSQEAFSGRVHTGDGDFATANTLWDFKVSKKDPTNAHTLQLLMYWIMGQRCEGEEFSYLRKLTNLGIFNPRLNKIYTKAIAEIPKNIIQDIKNNVFCY